MKQGNQLTNRENEVLTLLLQGKSNKLIALSLGITNSTIEFHLKNIYTKFQVNSRFELFLKLKNVSDESVNDKLGLSIVDIKGENTENRDRLNSRLSWVKPIRDTASIIGKELFMKILLKKPSAFLPPAMSFAALFTVIIHIAIFGIAPQADEVAAAHIWQILMIAQIPIIAFFIFKWLPRNPINTLAVLALQGSAALAAIAPVFLLKW